MMDKYLFDDLLGLDEEAKGCVSWLGCTSMMIIVLFVVAMLTCSCSRDVIRVIEVERDTVYQSKVLKDSVVRYDSIYVKEWQKGDTVFVYRDRWLERYRDRVQTDTVYQEKIREKEVEKVVEVNRLYWWQKSLMWGGVVLLVAMTGGLVYLIYKVYKRMKVP